MLGRGNTDVLLHLNSNLSIISRTEIKYFPLTYSIMKNNVIRNGNCEGTRNLYV